MCQVVFLKQVLSDDIKEFKGKLEYSLIAHVVYPFFRALLSHWVHFHNEEMEYRGYGPSLTPLGVGPHYLRSCLHSSSSLITNGEGKKEHRWI